ncbi:two-component system response regulator WspF [Acidovorax soli]|uniref:protein-glutamate methylesterase n=1 Tax=Acidovorax soli TaxID=592050 RepID=A0A7X0UBD5_9BURK|nr:chemotaxis-specific protein-glutamate methyltransferase CheB [Acidovorax soli]MBB6562232.1 two-component system response regulator WspF [Acidovorax soli]
MKLGLLLTSLSLALGLRHVLEPAHGVRWLAMEDAAALRLCHDEPPDLLLLQLDSADRVELTRRIMDEAPCPVLLLDLAAELSTEWVFNALGHGALDVVHLPGLADAAALDPALLLRKIQNIQRLTSSPQPAPHRTTATQGTQRTRLIAIGASAGGPAALSLLLHALPPDLDAALVLVQHLDDQFSAGMAEWLARESPLPVRLVQAGEAPQPGVVLLAGRNEHLCLGRHGELRYTPEPTEQIYRPSIDVFFHSLATQWQGDAIGVLLTGMGRDGAEGLKAMRERGFPTITQDQASSAVWGMPKAAAAIGAAAEVLPLERIATRLAELCSRAPTRRTP